MAKAAQHRGSYHVQSRRMNAAATMDPTATCWRCGHTLAQHPDHQTGRPAHWTCGHVNDMTLYALHPSPYARHIDGLLCAPEVSVCNYVDPNRRRGQRDEDPYR